MNTLKLPLTTEQPSSEPPERELNGNPTTMELRNHIEAGRRGGHVEQTGPTPM